MKLSQWLAAFLIAGSGSVFALPVLQLDIPGAAWVVTDGIQGDESIIYSGGDTFMFSPLAQATPYNVQHAAGSTPDWSGSGMYYVKFEIDMSGMMAGMDMHFDLYSTALRNNGKPVLKAPYSHDVAGRGLQSVTEPGVLLMLALGVFGLVWIRHSPVLGQDWRHF